MVTPAYAGFPMEQERWPRLEELLHEALECAPEQRQAFLNTACGGDADLRRELESLLAQEHQAGSFLEKPALDEATVTMVMQPGRQLGPYRIVSPLGAGGMGEVYRAHDSKLGRDVAIKMLPAEFARDAARLARFRREARALAALNHPNIAAIYGLEEAGDIECLVLERHCQLEQARDVFCPGWSVVWESAQAAVTVRQTAKDRDRKNR